MGDGDISDCVEGINTITTLKCPNENIHMRIQAGVYTSIEQQADSFILDIDTFVMEKINANLMTAKEQLNILHEKPWNFFRYSITDKLYNLMEPVK